MRNLEDLKNILQEHKEELSQKYGVIEVGIFGSYVKNKQDEASDVDILVDFRESVDLLTFVHLKNYLSELVGTNVDLVMKKALKPGIGRRILREVMYIE
ncbi:MAG: nucleotidyltransferase [Candidatus Schekmanbacteria bacterium]|nr:MAG: nucleotidyltransferase [Candidatus Schekmanbacteria bacterium]